MKMHLLLKFCLACSCVVGCSAGPDYNSVSCMAPACSNPYTPPDQCCPICRGGPVSGPGPVSGCVVDGVQYREGVVVQVWTNPCQECTCRNGSLQCNIMMCAACEGDIPPGQCCPSCGSGPVPVFGP